MLKVSVVVPIYNLEQYIGQCIESIINQTYKNLEILLVNDGSTDNSLNICEKFREIDSRIKVINKTNGGVSSSRNYGIKNATGDYICFIDGDDWLEKDYIQLMMDYAISFCADIVRCDSKKDYKDNFRKLSSSLRSGYYSFDNMNYELFPKIIAEKESDNSPICSVCFNLYKMNIIKENNIRFDQELVRLEDLLFNVEYLLNSSSFYYLKHRYLYNIRNVPSSETKEKYIPECFMHYFRAYSKIKKLIQFKNVNIENIDWQFNQQLLFYCLVTISNEVSKCNNKHFSQRIAYIRQIFNLNDVKIARREVKISKKLNLRTLKMIVIKYNMPLVAYLLQWVTKRVYAPIINRIG